MAKTLEAHDKLIREIFEGSYQFEIPDYQRPYAWTTEQAGELFDDLISAMQDARVSGATSQYFLGSIVLIKNDREPKSSVVDGQQRLSTLTMLFAVLREAMPHAADDITDFLYKKGKVSLGEKNEYRLTAREEESPCLPKQAACGGRTAPPSPGITSRPQACPAAFSLSATALPNKPAAMPASPPPWRGRKPPGCSSSSSAT